MPTILEQPKLEEELRREDYTDDDDEWCDVDPDRPNFGLCGARLCEGPELPDAEVPQECRCPECVKIAATRGINF